MLSIAIVIQCSIQEAHIDLVHCLAGRTKQSAAMIFNKTYLLNLLSQSIESYLSYGICDIVLDAIEVCINLILCITRHVLSNLVNCSNFSNSGLDICKKILAASGSMIEVGCGNVLY